MKPTKGNRRMNFAGSCTVWDIVLSCYKCRFGTGFIFVNGRVRGPLLALVCPFFRKKVIVTCKIVSFLCSLDKFLLQNVIVFIVWKQILKWRSFEKSVIFDLLFTLFSHQEKHHITYLHKYTYFAHPLDFFLPFQFCKNYEFIIYSFSLVRLQVLILILAILEQSINNKMVSKIGVRMSTTYIHLH